MEYAKLFKAFSDENRIKILQSLKQGEKCACDLLETLDISQSTLSHHMKILLESGFVKGRNAGKWMHYRICVTGMSVAIHFLQELSLVQPSSDVGGTHCET